MRFKTALVPALALGLALAGVLACGEVDADASKPPQAQSGVPQTRLVTKTSAGPVRIGMTVAEVRKAMPGMRFARTVYGDGVAAIELRRGEALEMMLYAGEEDPEKPIDEKAKVEMIGVWGPGYKTAEGVHPGMRLSEVETKYGKLTKITLSEIESHEYAEFARQPAGLKLRAGLPDAGLAGTYTQGSQETKVYARSAVVTQIEIYK